MKRITRAVAVVVLGTFVVAGVTACDGLPQIDPSRLPDISIPSRPSESAEPEPTETVTEAPEPEPTETVTEAPEPQPTETVTEAPEPQPTETVTASPEPEATATASASPSPEPGDDAESGSFPWWAWLLAGAALVTLLVVWWRVMAARRSWDRSLEGARSEVAWIEGSLVPQVLVKPTAVEASQTWEAALPRTLDVDRAFHGLVETAPTEERRADAARGLDALRALTAAMDAETATHADDDAETLRSRRAAVDSARAQARGWVSPPPS